MIVFKNKGEINIRAVTTLGVNVKDTDSPVGYFGTGLKYSIATLLRNDQEIVIYSGQEKITFKTLSENIRGKDFNLIEMRIECGGGVTEIEKLGFTTELGRNWTLEDAFRELWCNTHDEKSAEVYEGTARQRKGETRIVVTGEEFAECYHNRGDIILDRDDEPIEVAERAEVYDEANEGVYYRGIRVYKPNKKALFTYNLIRAIDLTEDRTARYSFQVHNAVVNTVVESDNRDFIKRIVTAGDDYWEHKLDFTDASYSAKPTRQFIEVLSELKGSKVNSTARDYLKDHLPEPKAIEKYRAIMLSESAEEKLEKAKEIAAVHGFYSAAYTVIPCKLEGYKDSMATEGCIFLNLSLFEGDENTVAKELIKGFITLMYSESQISSVLLNHILAGTRDAAAA